jgi:hypothetical protein
LDVGELPGAERRVGLGQLLERRAVSSVRAVAPTVAPVASATQCAALRCPLARQTFVSSTRRARRALIAVQNRSARAASLKSSTARCASNVRGINS